tara:strand:+ start:454 stop:885 length:432 start_codon:yes stop_codon:yes gene_type:complete
MEVMMHPSNGRPDKYDYTKEYAAEDRKNALLATLEMMNGVVNPVHYGTSDAYRVADWLSSFSSKEINKISFYALLDHIDFIFNWIGMEMDIPTQEVFDKYVEFLTGAGMRFIDHVTLGATDEQFDDAMTIFDMEQTMKEDDDE